MERQELVEEILRLYVWALDEIDRNTALIIPEVATRQRIQARYDRVVFNRVKVYIEDHFRPLV